MCGSCNASLDAAPAPRRDQVQFAVVDEMPPGCNKGCTNMETGQITVHRPYWESFSKPEQDVVLAHELGHALSRCESDACADRVAGSIMRQWGYSRAATVAAINRAVRNRGGAGPNAGAGWDSAQRSLDTSFGTVSTKTVSPTASPTTVVSKTSLLDDLTVARRTGTFAPVTTTTPTTRVPTAPISSAPVSGGSGGGIVGTVTGRPTIRPNLPPSLPTPTLPGQTLPGPAGDGSLMGQVIAAVIAGGILYFIFEG